MKVEYINPFVSSTIAVFDTMLGCAAQRGKPFVRTGKEPVHDISGIIGLSGKARGTVVLSLGKNVALAAAGAMLGETPPEINADVVDVVGELTNMIAGGAKSQLASLSLSISLPTVITGTSHAVEFPSNVTPISIPFACDWGIFNVDFGLVEQAVPARSLTSTTAPG
jgi:chemotaxis protein CheX